MVWHRFIWPFLLLYIGAIRTGNSFMAAMAVEGNVRSNSAGVEKVTCYINMFLMIIFVIAPKTFLYTLFPCLLITALQIGIVIFKSSIGMCAFGWVFSIGGLGNNNQQTNGMMNNQQYVNNQMYNQGQHMNGSLMNQQYQNQMMNSQFNGGIKPLFGRNAQNRQDIQYNKNVSMYDAAGTINNEEQWAIREATKQTYISKSGKVTYAHKRVKYELQGLELCQVNGIGIYALNVITGFDTLLERLPYSKQTYCTGGFFKLQTKGIYYFVTNQGELVKDIMSLYNPVADKNMSVEMFHVSQRTRLYVADSTVALYSESMLQNDVNILIVLRHQDNTLIGEIESKYSLDIKETRRIRDGSVLVYVFDTNTFELLRDSVNVSNQVESVQVTDNTISNSFASNKHYGEDREFMYKGIQGVTVNKCPYVHILNNGHLVVRYKSNDYEYAADKETDINGEKFYVYIFDTGSDIVNFIGSNYIKEKLVKDDKLTMCVNLQGMLFSSYSEEDSQVTNSVKAEAEEERLTMQDLKKMMSTGIAGFKVLKMKAEDISVQIKNRGMIKDGIYNTGAVDLMCRFGELRCCVYEERFPVLQAFYLGRLVASYAVPDIIDKISDNWYEDVPIQDFYNHVGVDLDSMIGQMKDAIVNIWVVKGDVIYFLSIVLYLCSVAEEEVAVILQYTKRLIMMSLSNEFVLDGDDTVCYIESISSAESNKLVLNQDTVVNRSDLENRHYYDINMFDVHPDIIMKRCNGLTAEQIQEVKDEFTLAGVVFSLRYPLLQSWATDNMRMIKFLADNMMLRFIDGSRINSIEIPSSEASVYKICRYLDNNIFGKKAQINNVIKKWRKDIFIISIQVADGFEFSFIQLDTKLLQNDTPILSTIKQPLITLSFWSVNKESVLEKGGSIVVYMFKKG